MSNFTRDEQLESEEQLDLLEEEADLILGEAEAERFNFSLTLKVQGSDKIANSIQVGAGRAPGNRIEEYLFRVFSSDRFKRVLRAVVGEPLPFSERATLPGSSSSRQTGEEGRVTGTEGK
jgi:hypothetical protein